MALVHRFTLPDAISAGEDIFIAGIGLFTKGVLDVPVANGATIAVIQAALPHGAQDVGQVDTSQVATPVQVNGDPWPQYVTPADLVSSVQGGTDAVALALKAAYALHGEASQNLTAALPNLMTAIRSNNDASPATLRIIGGGSSVGVGATLPDASTQAPVKRFGTRLGQTLNKLGNLLLATTNGSVNGTTITDFNNTDYATAKTTAGGTPTVVLLCFGMNDGMNAQYHAGQTYPGVYAALKTAIQAVQLDGGDPIVVTSPHPHSTRTPWNDSSFGAISYPPGGVAVPALTAAAGVITADWAATGVQVPVSYRHLRVNQAMRRAAMELGVPVIDAERYWFKALASNAEDTLFNVGEYAHPNLLGHQLSYWPAIDDFMRGLSASTLLAAPPLAVAQQRAVKNTNLGITNSTTLVSDSQLVLKVGAGQVWEVEYDVFYATNVTADIKLGIAYPSGCTGSLALAGVGPSATANGDVARFQRSPLSGTSASINAGGNTQDGWAKLRALVRVGSTSGNVTFQAAQTTADPSTTTVYADSTLRATRLS